MSVKQSMYVLQFVVIRIIIGLFVIFVMEESFVDFVLRYWLYFLLVSFSYFYYYSIQYDLDKKSELIRNVLVYGNVYLFAHIFFRPLLNISHELFVLLGLIILGIWWTTKLTTRWKYLLQFVGGLLVLLIIISGMLYLYPDKPDVEGFMRTRVYKIWITGINENVSEKEAYIQIIDDKRTSKFDIVPYFEKQLNESCKILYPSSKKQRQEDIFIITPYGDVFLLFPQSEVSLEFNDGELVEFKNLNGEIGFLSGVFDSSMIFSGGANILSIEQQEKISGIQYQYKYDLVSFLKNQISDNPINLANSTVMYNIDGKIIKLLAKIFPATFGKNLSNYNEFQRYFEWISEDEYNIGLGKYDMKQKMIVTNSSFWSNLVNNLKVGKGNIYSLFKKH